MNVVIDTNIVVSAVLKDRDPEAIIRFVIEHPQCEWIASPDILAEYVDVLKRPKFQIPALLIQEWSELFGNVISVVDAGVTINFPRDQKDAKFLACALAAEADYLITGDRDFTEAYKLLTTTVCSVTQFKRLVIDTEPHEPDAPTQRTS
jgi:putative PIN family toxin of toxin-antitoxin system